MDTYALLDQGSTCTFFTDALANTFVHLQASDLAEQSKIALQHVYTRPDIVVGLTSFVLNEELRKWQHFDVIEIPDIDAREVQMIIGNNVPQALMPLEVCSGKSGEP